MYFLSLGLKWTVHSNIFASIVDNSMSEAVLKFSLNYHLFLFPGHWRLQPRLCQFRVVLLIH